MIDCSGRQGLLLLLLLVVPSDKSSSVILMIQGLVTRSCFRKVSV
jgi:hypothetical protein